MVIVGGYVFDPKLFLLLPIHRCLPKEPEGIAHFYFFFFHYFNSYFPIHMYFV